jgi:type VII secretion protein EccE
MSESLANVRAATNIGTAHIGTARVGTGIERRGPAILTPRRRPGYLGPLHVIQLVLVEAAVLAVLATLRSGVVALAGAVVVSLALLIPALSRRQGRWWLDRRSLARHFHRRQSGSRRGAQPQDPRLWALHSLAPGLSVADVAASDGSPVGVARDDAGWYAAAMLTPSSSMRDDPRPAVPLDALAQVLSEARQPGAVLQVVTHTIPVPGLGDAAGLSYRELAQRFGSMTIPVDQVTWIAVRLDARTLAEAGPGSPAETAQAPAVVAGLLRSLIKHLRPYGLGAQPLDRDGLLAALARSCDLVPTNPAAPSQPREDWRGWHSGQLLHRSYWLRGWPSLAQAGPLLDWLATAPAAMASVALIVAADGDNLELRCLVRVAAPPERLSAVCAALEQGVRRASADLFELDGEQAPAVYASAPTGGGPR